MLHRLIYSSRKHIQYPICLFMNPSIRIAIHISSTRTLFRNEKGLQLVHSLGLFALCIRITSANLNCSEYKLLSKRKFIILVNDLVRTPATIFIIFGDTLSGPVDLFGSMSVKI